MPTPPYPQSVRGAQVISVIEITVLRGAGTRESILREVKQYWTLDGLFLAEYDPIEDKELSNFA